MTTKQSGPTYKFDDRRRGADKLVVVLTGHKEFCWDFTVPRLAAFVPTDADVCLVAGGASSDSVNRLKRIARNHGWSFLQILEDNIPLATTLPIHVHKDAQVIWKIDEDVFVTRNFFEQTLLTYQNALREGRHRVGLVAPLINVNGYGYLRVLKKIGAVDEFSLRFGKPKFGAYFTGPEVPEGSLDAFRPMHADVDAAKFMWGFDGTVPRIDELDARFGREATSYSVCPHRFSIGAVLIPRATWEKVGKIKFVPGEVGFGAEERELCNWCMDNSHAILVSENTAVGHLSFGLQTELMRINLAMHPEFFVL